ncbi:MAG: MoaD/ThiS family protein [Nanoarchaeota archaeon]
MVNVFIERENKFVKNVKARNAEQVMQILNINPETVLIIKNNELILAEENLNDNDDLKFLSVISGG